MQKRIQDQSEQDKITVTVDLPEDLHKTLLARSETQGITPDELIRHAIRNDLHRANLQQQLDQES